jgi:DNA (cytosine-5)-methyltransferase 1
MAHISQKPNSVIDLFCGTGGLTLGALRAGFEVATAIDIDSRTAITFAKNFPSISYLKSDLSKLNGLELIEQIGFSGKIIQGIIGGPPCQGFSRIGRRNLTDVRNHLFDHFFRIVAEIQPNFYLAENVLGILDKQYNEVRQNALARLPNYHQLDPVILKASDFGAPTNRERVFFIGYLPQNLEPISSKDFNPSADIEKVNVGTALQGLDSKIDPDWIVNDFGWAELTFRPEGIFWDKIFSQIPNKVGYQQAIDKLQDHNLVSGCIGTRHTASVKSRYTMLPEGATDQPSRAVRLKLEGFCPTLRAGTGPEHGSYQALRPIHPFEPRVITPREAARLQGFPDWFIFDRTKWHSFRQIGNSVSPILSEAVLKVLKEKLLNRGITLWPTKGQYRHTLSNHSL